MITTIESISLTAERKAEIADLLVRAQRIVERVTPLAYGEFSIRQFRRDMFTGTLDEYLTDEDRGVLSAAHQIEGEIIHANVGCVVETAGWYTNNYPRLGVDMEDLVQEGFMAIIHAMYGYDGSSRMSTYFFCAVRRWIEDIWRHRKVRFFDSTSPDVNFDLNQVPSVSKDDSGPVGDPAILLRAMASLKGELTPLEQTVLDLYSEMGYGCYSEAARRTINPKSLCPFTRAAGRDAMIRVLKRLHEEYDRIDRASRKVA